MSKIRNVNTPYSVCIQSPILYTTKLLSFINTGWRVKFVTCNGHIVVRFERGEVGVGGGKDYGSPMSLGFKTQLVSKCREV